MVARFQCVMNSLRRHLILLQRWFVLRTYGLRVKKRKGLLVIDGNSARRSLRYRLPDKTVLRLRRATLPSTKTATEVRHELLIHAEPHSSRILQ